MTVKANYIDILNRSIFPVEIFVENGKITAINPINERLRTYVLPGFIDAHIHIESSMLLPSEFAKVAVLHGTVATVSDPHEIANIMGVEGINYMIENSKTVPFHFFFGAPSCVPATCFETAGAELDSHDVGHLMQNPDIWYLAEVMNYPAVIAREPEMMAKINAAHQCGKPVDGHAPGIRGKQIADYINAGISTDHECFTFEEGQEKLNLGMKVIIREGSAAKNFEALIPLLNLYPQQIMFCSDDKHPDDLLDGHINLLVKRALSLGYNLFDILFAACILPVKHYNLPVGLLQKNDSADFIIIDSLENFNIIETYIKGVCVAQNQQSLIQTNSFRAINKFNCNPVRPQQLELKLSNSKVKIIKVHNRQLITTTAIDHLPIKNGVLCSDLEKDILKIVVVNRYFNAPPSIAFIKNFGLKKGAIASCIAHDSHNIVAVGVMDEDLSKAINLIISHQGGISLAEGDTEQVLPLPVAGIMSNKSAVEIAQAYQKIHQQAKGLGCTLDAPFMSLSFMALLVIPSLKISDKGLFDGTTFSFTSVQA